MPEIPMPERIARLRQLASDHGGSDNIPDDDLAAIDYVRFTDDAEITRLLPIEKLAGLSVAAYMQEARAEQEKRFLPPFEAFTFEAPTNTRFGTRVEANRINQATLHLQEGLDSALQGFGESFGIDPKSIRYTDPSILEQGELSGAIRFSDPKLFIDDISENAISMVAQQFRPEEASRPIGDIQAVLLDEMKVDRYDDTEAEQIWLRLEALRSRITDIDELTQLAEKDFLFVNSPDGGYDKFTVTYRGREWHLHPEATSPAEFDNFAFHLAAHQSELEMHGFSDVAKNLEGATSFSSIIDALTAGLTSSELARELRTQEKILKKSRRGMTSEADIHEFNRQLHRLRAVQRTALQPLREMIKFFDMPRIFAEAVNREIKDIQALLLQETSTGTNVISIDPTYDSDKDKNPGRMSGDCTDGSPLPFDQGIGFHNLKVSIDQEHQGNIYLLDTVTSDGEKAWHLDAIQIPSATTDWEAFPALFVELMAEKAKASGVEVLTMNAKPFLISNYDYVGNAFLQYAGAGDVQHKYDQMAQPDTPDYSENPAIASTEIQFPEYDLDGYSQPQGKEKRQLVLWRNSSKSTKG